MTALDLLRREAQGLSQPPRPAASPPRPDTGALVQRVRDLIQAGRPGAARPLLAALRRVAPDNPELPEIEARLKLLEGDPAAACALLDAAIAAVPADALAGVPALAALHKTRVEARTALGDHVGACADAAEAVSLDRHDSEAKALLGLTLLELGHSADALLCLREASGEMPAHPSIRLGLAQAQERVGDAQAALATLDEGVLLQPRWPQLRNAAILLRLKLGSWQEAEALAEEARSAGIADACTFGLLGHALSKQERHDQATGAYAEALKLAPEDPYVRHLVASGGRVASADRAPVEYVRTVFDGYAGGFEEHLVSLGYRVPGLVRRVLEARAKDALREDAPDGARIGPVLDLGCGTGLLALACMDLPFGPWIGVDASPNMLAAAQQKELYAELAEDDLVQYLSADGAAGGSQFPVILAGDVLCYFGRLNEVLAAVAQRLAPGGACVFSLERQESGDAPALGRSGRWTHPEAYVRGAAEAAGLRVACLEHETLRLDADLPVKGMIVVLERPEGAE